MGVEASDDVPAFVLDSRLTVVSCDVESRTPETDSLELVPVIMPLCKLVSLCKSVPLCKFVPLCKLLGVEVDISPPSLDVLLNAELVDPRLPRAESWLDTAPVVEDAP